MILNMMGKRELDFAVVADMEEPVSGQENLVWVQTVEPMSGWCFSGGEPEEPMEGMVWFMLGNWGEVAFNALKSNAIHIRIISCRQYVSGLWEYKPMKLRKNGVWQELVE